MRSSESYRLVNDLEKSSHLLRCTLSKGTAECWAIWEIWLRVSFISSTLWTHWHQSCSLCSGKLGAASSGHTQDCLPSRCAVPCPVPAGRVTESNKCEAPEARVDIGWARCAARPFTDALDHGATESKARPRQPGSQSRSPAAGGCSMVHPQTSKGRVP